MTSESESIRELVRRKYAEAATRLTEGNKEPGQGCCPSERSPAPEEVFGGALYNAEMASRVGDAAISASLGCGVPTAVADLRPGETVLDLGSGGGADVLISAQRVSPGGRAIGLDMTDEMLHLARQNAEKAGIENVEFLLGYLEEIPLPDECVDVIISNCVINLAADKQLVLGEAARVLRGGGRLAISDVIADPDMDDETRSDMAQWTGCIAGALTLAQYQSMLTDIGFVDIDIAPTHRVHSHAVSAIIRATKPAVTTT
ncbi:MAG: arsenite methyltransferase [Ferrimicrobium sp.]|jgi:SAM-dependent methyltransferase|uniref:Arsenite methyltransferase n=1 Tax=Ferrimicrobium acidiphilum TaxID=121039 RepID=A0ABV3Y0Y9_9ACTN|nr:arsenite methyltransferase [Ferrimicrobium sp.]